LKVFTKHSLPTALRRAVRAEFSDPRCAYCQSRELLLGLPLEADHIVPTAAGGRTVFSNQLNSRAGFEPRSRPKGMLAPFGNPI
jgi:5-methylcytosine-specific restriction endonuclease McrA